MVQMISDGASAALLRVQCAFRTTGLSNFRYMKYINYSGVYVSKEPVIHTKRLKKAEPCVPRVDRPQSMQIVVAGRCSRETAGRVGKFTGLRGIKFRCSWFRVSVYRGV